MKSKIDDSLNLIQKNVMKLKEKGREQLQKPKKKAKDELFIS